jgi:carbonic anhydrase
MRVCTGKLRRVGIAMLGLAAGAACAPAGPVETVDAGEAPWSYEGETGPEAWGATCETGAMQSPVNLADAVREPLPGPTFRYGPAPLEVVNLGHTLQVNYAPGNTLALGNEVYQLLQYHFHTPAEHLLRGRDFPMALHLVHRNAAGQLAVVGVLIEEGTESAALRPLFADLPATEGQVRRDPAALLNPAALLPRDQTNFRYPGSLTTPPCTEGVQWIVMAEPIEMSRAQIAAIRNIIHTTNRPVQPLGERTILLDPAG